MTLAPSRSATFRAWLSSGLRITLVSRTVGLALTVLALLAPHLAYPQPTSAPQLVLVGRVAGNTPNIVMSTSADGVNWTPVTSVMINGAPALAVTPPNIFSD